MRLTLLATTAMTLALPVIAQDFGQTVDALLASQSAALFGIAAPLAASAEASVEEGYRTADQTAADQVALADGLTAEYLTRTAADSWDMMAFYPAEAPTHLIACIEGDREDLADGRMNPGVQAVDLASGAVTTLVRGTAACDGIRTTPWGTTLFTEEEDDGGAYEMIDPLALADVAIIDRATGETSDPAHVVRRMALPTMAWEGLTITPEGVVIAGDELRPGSDEEDADGGAIFKFIPAALHDGSMITSLDASPLAAGTTYAMVANCYGDAVQFGQGCEIGHAFWVAVDPVNARATAYEAGATGYYRPEDLHEDPLYAGPGLRFCWANTGNEGAANYAEVICGIDEAPTEIAVPNAEGAITLTTTVNRFVEGDTEFNSMDNLAFNPVSGQLFVIEDHDNGDIWACLPDGADRDIKTDGCIRILSVKDSSAEPTGFLFDATGTVAYVSIQHSDDTAMEPVDGYGTDDLVRISGFVLPAAN